MSNLNKVFLIGWVANEPESLSYNNDENSYVKFKLATNEQYKGKDGKLNKRTEFHTIISFGKLSEIILKYVKKGKLLFVEGRIRTKEWENEKTKQKIKLFSIFADEIKFLSPQEDN